MNSGFLELNLSRNLKAKLQRADDAWEILAIEELPFPIAFKLSHIRESGYIFQGLCTELLDVILKYFADIAIAYYLHCTESKYTYINDVLKRLDLRMCTGHWLELVNVCCEKAPFEPLLQTMRILEGDQYTARVRVPRLDVKPDRQGLLSSWLTIRNKLLAHPANVVPSEIDQWKSELIRLVRAVILLSQPIWSLDLVKVFQVKRQVQPLGLRGIDDFEVIPELSELEGNSCFLCRDTDPVLQLWPLMHVGKPSHSSNITLTFAKSDLYFLERVLKKKKKGRVPEYVGLRGGKARPPENAEKFQKLFNGKGVWENSLESSIKSTEITIRNRLQMELTDARENQLYDPSTYVRRSQLEDLLRRFKADSKSKALLITGDSKSGKTTAILQHLHETTNAGPAILVRAEELPREVTTPGELERLILEHKASFKGTLDELANGIATGNSEKLLIVFEAVDAFTHGKRMQDSSELFRRILELAHRYRDTANVKIICTFKASYIHAFMPEGKAPFPIPEELLFRENGCICHYVNPLSDSEVRELLSKLDVREERIDEYFRHAEQIIRNPMDLRRHVTEHPSGRLSEAVDPSKISENQIRRALKSSKDMERAAYSLMRVFKTIRGLMVSSRELARTDPRLFERLTKHSDRLLLLMRNMGVIHLVFSFTDDGSREWGISIAHDSLCPALEQIRLERSNRITNLAVSLLVILAIGITLLSAGGDLRGYAYAGIDEPDIEYAMFWADLDLTTGDSTAVMQALDDQFHMKKEAISEVIQWLLAGVFFYTMLWMGLFYFAATFVSRWIRMRSIKRMREGDIRIAYYKRVQFRRSNWALFWFSVLIFCLNVLLAAPALIKLGEIDVFAHMLSQFATAMAPTLISIILYLAYECAFKPAILEPISSSKSSLLRSAYYKSGMPKKDLVRSLQNTSSVPILIVVFILFFQFVSPSLVMEPLMDIAYVRSQRVMDAYEVPSEIFGHDRYLAGYWDISRRTLPKAAFEIQRELSEYHISTENGLQIVGLAISVYIVLAIFILIEFLIRKGWARRFASVRAGPTQCEKNDSCLCW